SNREFKKGIALLRLPFFVCPQIETSPPTPLIQARGGWLDKEDGLPSMNIIEGWYDITAIWAKFGFGIIFYSLNYPLSLFPNQSNPPNLHNKSKPRRGAIYIEKCLCPNGSPESRRSDIIFPYISERWICIDIVLLNTSPPDPLSFRR